MYLILQPYLWSEMYQARVSRSQKAASIDGVIGLIPERNIEQFSIRCFYVGRCTPYNHNPNIPMMFRQDDAQWTKNIGRARWAIRNFAYHFNMCFLPIPAKTWTGIDDQQCQATEQDQNQAESPKP